VLSLWQALRTTAFAKFTQIVWWRLWQGAVLKGFGDGHGIEALFKYPIDVAVTKEGWLVVADFDNHCIRTITPDGKVTSLAGGAAGSVDGLGANIIVADSGNHCIRLVSPAGLVSTLAGSGVAGFGDGEGSISKIQRTTSRHRTLCPHPPSGTLLLLAA
jgi:hypothetical protein